MSNFRLVLFGFHRFPFLETGKVLSKSHFLSQSQLFLIKFYYCYLISLIVYFNKFFQFLSGIFKNRQKKMSKSGFPKKELENPIFDETEFRNF